MNKFGEWLNEQLERRGWTQTILVERSGLSRGGVSNILYGNREPSPDTCLKIAKAFGVPPEDVLRIAGHLPQNNDPLGYEARRVLDLMRNMSVDERKELLEYALYRFKRSKSGELEE